VLVLAALLKVLLDVRAGGGPVRALLRPYLPMLAGLCALVLGYVLLQAARGAALAAGLGAYSVVVDANYTWAEGWHWTLYHFAELTLAVGIVPLAALGVLAGLAAVRGLPGAAERAFVAVAVPLVVLVVVQVALFASHFAGRIEERNMIYTMPVLLLALAVWIGRDLPRPALIASVAAVGSAALLLAIPLARFVDLTILSDTFALIPLLRLERIVSGGLDDVRSIMLLGALNAALAFLVLPRRIATVLIPVALGAYFVVCTHLVLLETARYARTVRALAPSTASWVDDRVGAGGDVPYLFGPSADTFAEGTRLWQLEFWNRSVGTVYSIAGAAPTGLPNVPTSIDPVTGRLVASSPGLETARYALANRNLDVVGVPLGQQGELTLYAVRPPLRVQSTIAGAYPDGAFGTDVVYDRHATPGGRAGLLIVKVSREFWRGPDSPARITVEIGPLGFAGGIPSMTRVTGRRTWTIHSGIARTFVLPTPRPPFRATVHAGSTFSPSDYGLADSRRIGAWAFFSFQPTS
jgi:hypothetical protein